MTSHLVIGDSHAKPGVSNVRFDWLGRLIADRQPDVVIDMGDFADMCSLSSYDRGKRSFEGRRYNRDIDANIDARRRINVGIDAGNTKLRDKKKATYKPRKVALLGNHQERILRATMCNAELDGTISINDLKDKEFGWEVHDYLVPVVIDGISYCHYFVSGIEGRAIGGEHPAASILKKQFVSCTSAHSHIRDFCQRTNGRNQKILGLVAGCYFDHWEDYAGPANHMWWPGVILKHNVKDGYYDPEFIGMAEIRKRYG